ncbi:MAG TPA: GIY-YIG nuclease family protein, partial [Saprospiraceae bacterium]|nr:GIY-YIG nuclease family protein [Saprospiraceae bacterium]
METEHFVYILQSQLDNSFYIGSTNDLQRRVDQHNAGLSQYTSTKIPWKIVYVETLASKTEALKREKFL